MSYLVQTAMYNRFESQQQWLQSVLVFLASSCLACFLVEAEVQTTVLFQLRVRHPMPKLVQRLDDLNVSSQGFDCIWEQ